MNSQFPIRFACVMIAVCASFMLDSSSRKAVAAEIQIQLNDAAVVYSEKVLVSSVGAVSCSDPVRKTEIEAIELKLLDLKQPSETISKRFINIRLIIAGIRMEDLSISGAEQTVVTFQQPQQLTDTQIEEQALHVLSQAVNAAPDDLQVLLQSGFVQSLPDNLREMNALQLKILPPARRSLGPVTLSVQLWKDNSLLLTRSAVFDVRRRQRVAIARVSLSREVPINESNVHFENRFLTTEVDELDPNQILGRNVRGSVIAGSFVQMRDLQTTMQTNRDMLVKKGDAVQVIAVAQRLRTSIRNIEALEDGQLGDRIRMKNRDSGKEIVGEVLGPGQAIVRVR